MPKDDFDIQETNFVQTSIKLNNDVLTEIDNAILRLKKENKDLKHTKQRWITAAILDKINRGKKNRTRNKNSQAKKKGHLSIILTEKSYNDFEKDVLFYKTIDETYTKKKWILEAIKEKIEKENLV